MKVFVANNQTSHIKSLLGAWALFLMLPLWPMLAKPTPAPLGVKEAAAKTRLKYLDFPQRSVGDLQAYKFNPNTYDFGATYVGKASGKVAVPVEAECGLVVNYDGALDLSFWNRLPAGALVVLVANNFEISDDQLLALNHLEKLKVVEMSSTEIGNRGFAHFKDCSNLVELVTPSCLITGAALVHIKDLSNLKRLVIDHNDLDDASLANLKGLTNLLALRLQACKIGDSGVANLKNCERIYDLDIGQNKRVTDNSLPSLLSLKQLSHLDLTDTSVTIVGIKQLAKLPKLTRLTLAYDQLSAKQIADLHNLMPRCKIENGRKARVPLELFDPISKKAH